MDEETYQRLRQYQLRIEQLDARVAELKYVLSMGIDDQSADNQFVGEAEIDADEAGGYRCIPTAEIERVLGKKPECPHFWSVWQIVNEETLEVERACKWCGILEALPGDERAKIRVYPAYNEDAWLWVREDDNG